MAHFHDWLDQGWAKPNQPMDSNPQPQPQFKLTTNTNPFFLQFATLTPNQTPIPQKVENSPHLKTFNLC